ncbi:EAL domain-containing protein [Aeromonas veronii]
MHKFKNRFFMRIIFFVSTMMLVFFAVGFLMYVVFLWETEKWIESSTRRAVMSIESILDYGEMTNQSALKVKGLPCKEAVLELRRQAVVVPYIRSVNLASNNKIYCSSLFGDSNFDDKRDSYKNGKLLLMSGNQVQKSHPIIAIRSESGDTSSISGIDSIYFSTLLAQQEGDLLILSLYINDEWLAEDGLFYHESPIRNLTMSQSSKSARYPFSIYGGLNYPTAFDAFLDADIYYLVGLFLIISMFSIAIWMQFNKPRSFLFELQRALNNKEFVPYAQPLVDAVSREVIGVEILMRWMHPTQGMIRPDLFIPQAEESGLIVPMTASLLKDTAKILKQFHHLIPRGFHVGVNITAQHCKEMKLFFDCQEFLSEMKSEKIKLVLELTERQALEPSEDVMELFARLNDIGVLLAIDDFGTGHSSLAYLKNFNVGSLKIDMSFIQQIGEGSLSEHLIDNIVDLGRRLSLTLVAEGVENDMQANFLQRKGVNYLQGFMFGKPAPLSDALAYFNEKI